MSTRLRVQISSLFRARLGGYGSPRPRGRRCRHPNNWLCGFRLHSCRLHGYCLRDYGSLGFWFFRDQFNKSVSDRGGVPDLSVSGDKSDSVVVDPHDPSTTSKARSANAVAEPTPDGYQPCRHKIILIMKINSCMQSKNEQESRASNLNITRRWSLNYTTAARWRLFGCSLG
jgi:hypothetical protein